LYRRKKSENHNTSTRRLNPREEKQKEEKEILAKHAYERPEEEPRHQISSAKLNLKKYLNSSKGT